MDFKLNLKMNAYYDVHTHISIETNRGVEISGVTRNNSKIARKLVNEVYFSTRFPLLSPIYGKKRESEEKGMY